MGPVFLLLATNAFFLVSIFYVVVTKLRSTGKNYLGEDGLTIILLFTCDIGKIRDKTFEFMFTK